MEYKKTSDMNNYDKHLYKMDYSKLEKAYYHSKKSYKLLKEILECYHGYADPNPDWRQKRWRGWMGSSSPHTKEILEFPEEDLHSD